MEVDGEGPDQVNGSVTVETGQQISEFGGDSGRGAGLAESLGKVPHLFDGVEEVLAVLADKGVAQLVTQSPDVGAQCCVSGSRLGSGRRPREKRCLSWARQYGHSLTDTRKNLAPLLNWCGMGRSIDSSTFPRYLQRLKHLFSPNGISLS